jgi:hypothetical protein
MFNASLSQYRRFASKEATVTLRFRNNNEELNSIKTHENISVQLSKDWSPMYSEVNQLESNNIWTVSNILSHEECQQLIDASERVGYDVAAITLAKDKYVMATNVRNNTRTVIDDREFAEQLWERLKYFVPELCTDLFGHETLGEGYTIQIPGCNERFRFYRYDSAQRFKPHVDGSFSRVVDTIQEKSFITCMVYLNNVAQGGATNFLERNKQIKFTVQPVAGNCLFFVHRGNLHEGEMMPEESKERKYVIRTDIMYKRPAELPNWYG